MTDLHLTILVREPDAGKPPVRFDEREAEPAQTAPPLDSTEHFLGPAQFHKPLKSNGLRKS
jgi:hypothetical protein